MVVLAGCRLDVVANVDVAADGSGTVGVVFHLDEALLDELDALGVDPTAEIEAAVLEDEDWELRRSGDDTRLTLTLERAVDDAMGFGDVLRDLASGLSSDDPALLVDIEVAVAGGGSSQVEGVVGFRPPASAGLTIDDEPLGPTSEELAAIVGRAVQPTLEVTLPGVAQEHDADDVDGRTLRWVVPVGSERTIMAVAAPAPWWELHALWLAVGVGVGAVLLLGVLIWTSGRRRRRRRTAANLSWT